MPPFQFLRHMKSLFISAIGSMKERNSPKIFDFCVVNQMHATAVIVSRCHHTVPTVCPVSRVCGSGTCCARSCPSSARTCDSRDCLQNTRTSWSCCAANEAAFQSCHGGRSHAATKACGIDVGEVLTFSLRQESSPAQRLDSDRPSRHSDTHPS